MAEPAHVAVERRDRVALLIIDHPPANALSAAVLDALDSAVDDAMEDPKIKVIVITGRGEKFFVAGADIGELAQIATPAEGTNLAKRGQQLFTKIEHLSKPVIAAVNGIAVGGGCELAMACHLRVVGEHARFGQPEINLGLIPGYGGTQRLTRLIGRTHATEWTLTGRMVDAAEASTRGLCNRVVPAGQTLDAAVELGNQIAAKGAKALAAALDAIRAATELPVAEGMKREAVLFGQICETADKAEGVRAFLEKRAPKFVDA